jgi:Asp-tRNA(Asn)/Glu-tRNA(Gln) amidotransferase A subunit family amidase
MEHAIAQLEAAGAQIIDPVIFSKLPHLSEPELELLLYEKASLNPYLAAHPRAKVRSLADVIRFNQVHAARVMPYFQQELLERDQEKGDLRQPDYLTAKAECRHLARTEGIDRAMREHELDAIIAPTHGTLAFTLDPIVGDKKLGAAPLWLRWQATRTLLYRPASSMASRLACPSLPGRIRRAICSATPMPSNRPPRRGMRRVLWRRLSPDAR